MPIEAIEQDDICPRCGATVVNPYKQREWEGLTDNDILYLTKDIPNASAFIDVSIVLRKAEAKLKTKNHTAPRQYTDLCGND